MVNHQKNECFSYSNTHSNRQCHQKKILYHDLFEFHSNSPDNASGCPMNSNRSHFLVNFTFSTKNHVPVGIILSIKSILSCWLDCYVPLRIRLDITNMIFFPPMSFSSSKNMRIPTPNIWETQYSSLKWSCLTLYRVCSYTRNVCLTIAD